MPGTEKPVVLFLNHWAKQLGGAEYSLSDILAAAGPSMHCHLVVSEPGPLVDKAKQQGVICHIVPCHATFETMKRNHLLAALVWSWKDLGAYGVYVFRLRALVRRLAPRLVHANVPKSHVALFLLARTGYSGQCCFHIREIFKKRSLSAFLYALLYSPRKSTCIAISHAVKQALPLRLQKRATVIYNGVYIPATIRQDSEKQGVRLLYLGRIVPWKGCHLLITIMAKLCKRFPSEPVTMSLIGDTSYWSEEYRNTLNTDIQKLGLSECCTLHAHVADPQAAYTSHDIFCHAAFQEPFGRTLAEAQAYGLPVVAFSSGGVAEVVADGKSGLLVEYPDVDRFVDALATLITDPEQRKIMGDRGRERACTLFDREKQVPQIISYLEHHCNPE